jgi:hypothetical protein
MNLTALEMASLELLTLCDDSGLVEGCTMTSLHS